MLLSYILLSLVSIIGGITLLDLVLSGDNALVVGTVAARLPEKQRLFAIAIGGGLAILFRILFSVLATLLLFIPYLQAIGAGLILWVAYRLLTARNEDQETDHASRQVRERRFFSVIGSIVVADLSMSLDNMLAIGALAQGNAWAIIVGLVLSVAILMLASALVARLMKLLPWLLDLAALVLAWTAASMLIEDQKVGPFLSNLLSARFSLPWLGSFSWSELLLFVLLVGGMLVFDIFLRIRKVPSTSQTSRSRNA